MISCLLNYIGAKNIAETPTSGRYVNELAGITTDRINETFDGNDDYDVESQWETIERVAIKKFEQKLLQWAKKFFINYSIVGTTTSGQYRKKTLVAQSTEYKGVLFDYDFFAQKALSILIPFVYLYSDEAVTTTIRVFNAATGEEINSKEFTLTAGDNKLYLGWEFPIWRYPKVFVVYNASEVTTIKQDPYGFNGRTSLQFSKVTKTDDVISDNITASGSENGLLVNYSINCSIDNFTCDRLLLFEEAYIYCLASEVLQQSIHSENINRYTLLDYESAKILKDEYEMKFNEMISSTLSGMTMDDDDLCFVCSRAVNHRVMLP